jgi:hypothetical protein
MVEEVGPTFSIRVSDLPEGAGENKPAETIDVFGAAPAPGNEKARRCARQAGLQVVGVRKRKSPRGAGPAGSKGRHS